MIRRIALIAVAIATSASAQTIYEPVVVQHGGQNPYYYAGRDPYIHEAARFPYIEGATWGRVPGYAFVSPRRIVVERRVRTFSDVTGPVDLYPWGFTPDQVSNEANARLPRYVRKRQLIASGTLRENGLRVVPPDAPTTVMPRGSIFIRPALPPMYRRGPTLIIPRSLMEKRLDRPASQRPA